MTATTTTTAIKMTAATATSKTLFVEMDAKLVEPTTNSYVVARPKPAPTRAYSLAWRLECTCTGWCRTGLRLAERQISFISNAVDANRQRLVQNWNDCLREKTPDAGSYPGQHQGKHNSALISKASHQTTQVFQMHRNKLESYPLADPFYHHARAMAVGIGGVEARANNAKNNQNLSSEHIA